MTDQMTSQQRVMKALNFEEPDRVPRYESFWGEFVTAWRTQKSLPDDADILDYYHCDMLVTAAQEGPWPSQAGVLQQDGSAYIRRTDWGCIQKLDQKAKFFEEIEPGLAQRTDPDQLQFEAPTLDARYTTTDQTIADAKNRYAIFAKTGGPYLRAAHMRGTTNFLMDIAEDPQWVTALVERVTDHMTAVGVEQIKRSNLQSTGIGIFDDIATNAGLIMGRKSYQRIFYPSLRKMVAAYKAAGAAKVFHHCDGYVADVLDLWVDAGIDAVHPLEHRTGLDPAAIKEKYSGKLAIIGGLDNCQILPSGDQTRIKEHVLQLLRAARGGGFILAGHSIGPDVSIETYDYVTQLWRQHGSYPQPG